MKKGKRVLLVYLSLSFTVKGLTASVVLGFGASYWFLVGNEGI